LDSVQFNQIRDQISNSSEIVITTHYNPDGDAIGSSLALYHVLNQLGCNVAVIIPNDYPSFLKWMPGSEKILIYETNPDHCNSLIVKAQMLFCLDYNSMSRVKHFTKHLQEAKATKILIDHHIDPSDEFDFAHSRISVSSTSELLYEVITGMGYANLINKDVAECLFVGIMTDTGSFSFACNYSQTFEITASLIGKGIDSEHIHRLVYDTYSENRMRLLGFCLSDRLIVRAEYKTAYIWLTQSDLERFDHQIGDTEGVVNYALSIEGIKMAALFTERNDRIRISFRSKGEFSVNEFARKHYAGGGHRNAAGGDSFVNMKETLRNFEELLPVYFGYDGTRMTLI
jgi:bifunctional oligoribonuclease and PAP phosphatase NrnA